MNAPELVALMLADGRLPTGGHTQSAGLEAAVRAGLGADGNHLDDVAAYARDRLRTVTRVEAAVTVVTRHAVVTPPAESTRDTGVTCGGVRAADADIRAAEAAWAARTPSHVLRAVSRRQGRLLLRLAAHVWPNVLEHLPADGQLPRPIVLGVVGAVTGLSAEQLARAVAYDDAQTVVSASLKLLPVDPAEAATWLLGLHDDIERLVTDVAPLTRIEHLPADGAPLIDVLAHQHTTERTRLFHA